MEEIKIQGYEDRIIAFIDLEGFSNKVTSIKTQEDFDFLQRILKNFKALENRNAVKKAIEEKS